MRNSLVVLSVGRPVAPNPRDMRVTCLYCCAGSDAGGFKWWYGLLAGLGAALLLLAALVGALMWRCRKRQRDVEAQKSADAERARVAVRPGAHTCVVG